MKQGKGRTERERGNGINVQCICNINAGVTEPTYFERIFALPNQ